MFLTAKIHTTLFLLNLWQKCKESKKEESHLLSGHCKVYGDLTHKYSDLTDNEALVQFFKEVVARREVLDKLERNPVGGVNTNVVASSVFIDGTSQSRTEQH